jgi:hypothetical protein
MSLAEPVAKPAVKWPVFRFSLLKDKTAWNIKGETIEA